MHFTQPAGKSYGTWANDHQGTNKLPSRSSPPFSKGWESSRVEGSGMAHARHRPSKTERTCSGVISLEELRRAPRRCCFKAFVTATFALTSVLEHLSVTDIMQPKCEEMNLERRIRTCSQRRSFESRKVAGVWLQQAERPPEERQNASCSAGP